MKKSISFFIAIIMVVFIVACTETEVEQAGQDIQEALEETGEVIEEGLDDIEKELREMGEEVDEAIDTDEAPEIFED